MTGDAPRAAPQPYAQLVIRRDSVHDGALPDRIAVGDLLPGPLFGRPASGPGTVTAVTDQAITVQWGTPPAAPPAAAQAREARP